MKKTASLPVTVAADHIALRSALDIDAVAMGYDRDLRPALFWHHRADGAFRATLPSAGVGTQTCGLAGLNYPVTLVGLVSPDVLDYDERNDGEGAPDLLLEDRAPITMQFKQMSDDPELAAMEITARVLGDLDQRARHRAVRWLAAREGI